MSTNVTLWHGLLKKAINIYLTYYNFIQPYRGHRGRDRIVPVADMG